MFNALCFQCCIFLFFIFFWHAFKEIVWLLFMHCSWIVAALFDLSTIFSTSVSPVNSTRDSQISLFSNFFIKIGSHGTIHKFKNYFTTVFLVFNFQFQQNKFYPNEPLDECIVIDLPKLDRVPSINFDLCGALSRLTINVGWMVHAIQGGDMWSRPTKW